MFNYFLKNSVLNWRCSICGCPEYVNINKHYSNAKIFKRTKLITCGSCLIKAVHPMPSEKDITKLNNSYWKVAQSNDPNSRAFMYEQAKYRVKYLKNHLTDIENMKILDVGAGHAYIYDLLKKNNDNICYFAIETDLTTM